MEALAVQRVHVAVNAVAAVHLGHGRGGVGRRAQRLRVGERAAELNAVLVPVTPQHALYLRDHNIQGFLDHFSVCEKILEQIEGYGEFRS